MRNGYKSLQDSHLPMQQIATVSCCELGAEYTALSNTQLWKGYTKQNENIKKQLWCWNGE